MPKGIPKAGKRNRDNKKKDIQAAALRVFCHYGIFGTTVEKIAREAGVGPSTVLHHFAGKDELAEICVRGFASDFCARVRRVSKRPGIRYREQVDEVFELFKLNRDEWRLLLNVLCTPALEALRDEILQELKQIGVEVVGRHAAEVKEGLVFELAYSMVALYFNYVIGGNEQNYLRAREQLLAQYLLS